MSEHGTDIRTESFDILNIEAFLYRKTRSTYLDTVIARYVNALGREAPKLLQTP